MSAGYESRRVRGYALGLLMAVYALNFLDRQILAILQEQIKADLLLSDAQLGLLTGFAFALFYVTAGIPIARIADKSSRRNVIAWSVGIWSVMTALCGVAQNYWQLLLARVGVGAGEAGCSPPAHSMLSDIFPPARRATALSLYSAGLNIGIFLGFYLGGLIGEKVGWRNTLLLLGLPGVLIALIVRFTLTEPTRGFSEARAVSKPAPTLGEVFAILWSYRSFRWLSLGAGLSAFVGYGFTNWIAPFMVRTHAVPLGDLGLWLGICLGAGGALGTFLSGFVADRVGHRDKRWYLWVPALSVIFTLPFTLTIFLIDSSRVSMALVLIPGFMGTMFLGPCLALTHNLVQNQIRALASAILFLIINIIGLGLGPWAFGALSDFLQPELGSESLRYAMVYLLPAVTFLCALTYLRAGHHLRADMTLSEQRAQETSS